MNFHSPIRVLILVGFLVIAFAAGCERRTTPPSIQPPQPGTDVMIPIDRTTGSVAVLGAYTEQSGITPGRQVSPQVIWALFPDGKFVFSRNILEGGPAYYSARIDEASMASVLHAAELTVQNSPVEQVHTGPDMSTTTIFVRGTGERLSVLISSHELHERKGVSIWTQDGLVPLNGKGEERIIESWSPEYRRFRLAWTSLREMIASQMPLEGVAIPESDLIWRKNGTK